MQFYACTYVEHCVITIFQHECKYSNFKDEMLRPILNSKFMFTASQLAFRNAISLSFFYCSSSNPYLPINYSFMIKEPKPSPSFKFNTVQSYQPVIPIPIFISSSHIAIKEMQFQTTMHDGERLD